MKFIIATNNAKKLKELEKFGFELEEWDNYYRKYKVKYQVQINIYDRKILVFKMRENSNWGDYIGYTDEEEKIKLYVPDLIKANLVVKE